MSPRAQDPPLNGFVPVRVADVELAGPLPSFLARTPGSPHDRALVLVRLHHEPIAGLYLDIPLEGLSSERVGSLIWNECEEQIRTHLRADGLPEVAELSGQGVAADTVPACRQAEELFLRQAPPITVLIPSRERPERLRTCVGSILASEYPSDRVQIVIADNAPSSGGTRALAEELSSANEGRVTYVREDVPGSASARNRGLDAVKTDLVAMTDDDVVVDRNWLTQIARAFTDYPQAGAVSGLLWPTELETPAQLWFEQYGGFSRGFHRRVFDLQSNRPPDEPLYPWNAGLFGTGNNFSFRTAALRDIGGFDPALGNGTPALGGVDSEVLLRTILSGYQIVYEPRAVAHHAHRADYDGLCRQVYAYGAGLVAYYLKTVLADHRFAIDFARRLPAGIRWMRSPDSHINKHKLDDYPAELTWIERRGMLYGPFGYARSRRRYGPHPVYRHRRRRSGQV